MPIRPDALSVMFPSLGRRRFLNRHWPRHPAHDHGEVARLGPLAELGELGVLAALVTRSRMALKAMIPGPADNCIELEIQPSTMLSMCSAGATIACADVQWWHPVAAAWIDGLRSDLGLPSELGGCNLYLSPPRHGVAMHFDDHEIVVVQLSGRKRWRFAPNAHVRNPLHNSGRRFEVPVWRYADGPPPARMPKHTTVIMQPGSCLFLPRGYWHATDARELSVSLTFGFKLPSWLELMQQHVASELMLSAAWRESPWDAWCDADQRARAAERWVALRGSLIAALETVSLESLVPAPKPTASARCGRPASRRAIPHK